jgi:hypothetical protein
MQHGNGTENGIGGWDISGDGDLRDVTLPANLGRSREVDAGFDNDPVAQRKAATQLAYGLHGKKCRQCEQAESEGGLCPIGQQLYSDMRNAGVVE